MMRSSSLQPTQLSLLLCGNFGECWDGVASRQFTSRNYDCTSTTYLHFSYREAISARYWGYSLFAIFLNHSHRYRTLYQAICTDRATLNPIILQIDWSFTKLRSSCLEYPTCGLTELHTKLGKGYKKLLLVFNLCRKTCKYFNLRFKVRITHNVLYILTYSQNVRYACTFLTFVCSHVVHTKIYTDWGILSRMTSEETINIREN